MDDDIRNWLRAEDYITFLAKRQKGDQLPEGVVDDNPFSSNPWDYPEDSWYFLEESLMEFRDGIVVKTENGFWKCSSTITIPTESVLSFRNVFEFYQGITPEGTRTGWMMHRYHVGPNSEVAFRAQDLSSLCRLFWNHVERVHSSQPNSSPAAFADFHISGSDIIVRKEESEDPSRREADGSVFINDSYDDFIEMKDLVSLNGDTQQYNDLSDRSYFEFDDILTSDCASTSSGDSSNMSHYDEFFNINEVLGQIVRDASDLMEDEEKADCLSSFTGAVVQADRDKQLKASVLSPPKVNCKRRNPEISANLGSERWNLETSANLGCKSSSHGDLYFNVNELLRNIARDCSASVKEDEEKPDQENYTHSESVASSIGSIGVSDENEQSEESPSASRCSRTGQLKRNRSEIVSNHSNSSQSSDSSGSDSSSSCSSTDSSSSESAGSNSSSGCNSTSRTPQSRRRKPQKRLAKIGRFFCLP